MRHALMSRVTLASSHTQVRAVGQTNVHVNVCLFFCWCFMRVHTCIGDRKVLCGDKYLICISSSGSCVVTPLWTDTPT